MDWKSARKLKKMVKKSCTWKAKMYRISEYTPEFNQFDMVFGGRLKADSRWVILASMIPWKEVEAKYSKLFSENNGRPAIPIRVALGAIIIKEKKNLSDEKLVEDIRESSYLQFFLGYESYKHEIPFDPSMMVNFRKSLSADILKEVNKGTLIIDATCAFEGMRFPHDVTLLDEARRKAGHIIDVLHEKTPEGWEKPRTYRKKARKEFLSFILNRKSRVNTIRRAPKTQLTQL